MVDWFSHSLIPNLKVEPLPKINRGQLRSFGTWNDFSLVFNLEVFTLEFVVGDENTLIFTSTFAFWLK